MSVNIEEMQQRLEDATVVNCDYRKEGTTPESLLDGVDETLGLYLELIHKAHDQGGREESMTYQIEYIIQTLEYLKKIRDFASGSLAQQHVTGKNPLEFYWGSDFSANDLDWNAFSWRDTHGDDTVPY